MIGTFANKQIDKTDLTRIIQSNNRWNYSREEYIEILNVFIELLNKHTTVSPIKTVICEDTIYVKGEGRANVITQRRKSVVHKYDMAIEKAKLKDERKKDNDPLTVKEIATIWNLYQDNYTKTEIAEGLGMSRNTINKYCR